MPGTAPAFLILRCLRYGLSSPSLIHVYVYVLPCFFEYARKEQAVLPVDTILTTREKRVRRPVRTRLMNGSKRVQHTSHRILFIVLCYLVGRCSLQHGY
jgi:hypothetical protein